MTASQGRVVDMAGDAVFETAIGATEAVMRMQAALADRNTQRLDNRHRLCRVGVHLGDVIEKPDGTVYGDGVNIAARLESLADAGGVAVSGSVHDVVGRRLQADFEDLGEHIVKNIAAPVRADRIRGARTTAAPWPSPPPSRGSGPVQIIFASAVFAHVLAQAGRFEQADRGTLCLDRVEEIPPALQAKLLRPLQDATFERVGGGRTRRADVRFIAVTNRDLAELGSDILQQRDAIELMARVEPPAADDRADAGRRWPQRPGIGLMALGGVNTGESHAATLWVLVYGLWHEPIEVVRGLFPGRP